MRKTTLATLLFVIVLSLPICYAQSAIKIDPYIAARDAYLREVRKRISESWEPITFCTLSSAYNGETKVISQPAFNIAIDANGLVSSIETSRSTGIKALDVIAEDAVLSCSPLPALPEAMKLPHAIPCRANIDFAELFQEYVDVAGQPRKQCETYFCRDTVSDPVLTIHAIPIDVLERYPGIIPSEKIHGYENFRQLTINVAEPQLRKIRASWSDFFASHPKPTNEELLEKRKSIDLTYDQFSGGLLNSPRLTEMYGDKATGEVARQ